MISANTGDDGQRPATEVSLADLARELRQRLEINRAFGWAVPLGRGGPTVATRGENENPAERQRREALMAPIRDEVAACTRCGLCETRNRTVFGVGDPTARLMFVGEAPGYDEDRRGEPFVGRAGQLLDRIIAAMGLTRESVYIANIVKCRPPQNRNPDPGEIGKCLPYLERQIEIVSPEVIIALGGVATNVLLGSDLSLRQLRGRFHQYRETPLMPTYHPAYLLRNPGDKRLVWEDVLKVMDRLGLKRPE